LKELVFLEQWPEEWGIFPIRSEGKLPLETIGESVKTLLRLMKEEKLDVIVRWPLAKTSEDFVKALMPLTNRVEFSFYQ
jgi:hypothetical protein